MKIKNYTIIGASGFVGTRLIEQLGKDNCYNIDKNPSEKYPEITTIQNICKEGLLEAIPSSTEMIVLLAAEHRDDVSPTSLYYDVNVQGTRNVLDVMDKKGIKNIIFTSSVAVYGLDKVEPNEKSPVDPFNHYGKSKWQAENVLREWYQKDEENRSLTIIRPTVIFGENNRGNVYNLLKQIASGRFLMVGSGKNFKSMSYVGNVAAFIAYSIENKNKYQLFNYVDKPDTNMLDLIKQVEISLNVKVPSIKIPFFFGMICGYLFDILSFITRKKYSISSIRIKKFCATTSISSINITSTSFLPPFNIYEGLDRTLKNEF